MHTILAIFGIIFVIFIFAIALLDVVKPDDWCRCRLLGYCHRCCCSSKAQFKNHKTTLKRVRGRQSPLPFSTPSSHLNESENIHVQHKQAYSHSRPLFVDEQTSAPPPQQSQQPNTSVAPMPYPVLVPYCPDHTHHNENSDTNETRKVRVSHRSVMF